MKTVFISINSKYIHTLLSARYLAVNSVEPVLIYETNINVPLSDTLTEMFIRKPDVIAISTYIFNIEYVRSFLCEIKNFLPEVKIILGGYEVSCDEKKYLSYADYIMKGEGDFEFGKLITSIKNGDNIYGKIINCGEIKNLDGIKSPYTEEYCRLGQQKILYYESSRGCPFRCAYCMSSNSDGVRSFSFDRIKSDLFFIMKYNPKQIKFVDRTFNYDMKRAAAIFRFITDNFGQSNTNFHFEVEPELFSDEMYGEIEKAKKGLFQFEAGVQSYNNTALKAVNRKENAEILERNIKRLIKIGNSHVHVDLIAGLPEENYDSFVSGFNRLFDIKPHCLQLGFLKILKGSEMSEKTEGYKFYNKPPYEIISTPVLSYGDVVKLKTAEEMLELYYNSGRFFYSVNYILPEFYEPYRFFYELGLYVKNIGQTVRSLSAYAQCDALFNFAINVIKVVGFKENLENLIASDYKASGNARKWSVKNNG